MKEILEEHKSFKLFSVFFSSDFFHLEWSQQRTFYKQEKYLHSMLYTK